VRFPRCTDLPFLHTVHTESRFVALVILSIYSIAKTLLVLYQLDTISDRIYYGYSLRHPSTFQRRSRSLFSLRPHSLNRTHLCYYAKSQSRQGTGVCSGCEARSNLGSKESGVRGQADIQGKTRSSESSRTCRYTRQPVVVVRQTRTGYPRFKRLWWPDKRRSGAENTGGFA
jgi:hypothetical protein